MYVQVYFPEFHWDFGKCHYWFLSDDVELFETVRIAGYTGIVVDKEEFKEAPPTPLGKKTVSRKDVVKFHITNSYDDSHDDRRKEKLENYISS